MTEKNRATDTRVNPLPGGLTDLLHDSPWRAPVTLGLMACNILVFATMLGYGAGL